MKNPLDQLNKIHVSSKIRSMPNDYLIYNTPYWYSKVKNSFGTESTCSEYMYQITHPIHQLPVP
jgi:hypothetical protein